MLFAELYIPLFGRELLVGLANTKGLGLDDEVLESMREKQVPSGTSSWGGKSNEFSTSPRCIIRGRRCPKSEQDWKSVLRLETTHLTHVVERAAAEDVCVQVKLPRLIWLPPVYICGSLANDVRGPGAIGHEDAFLCCGCAWDRLQ